VLNQSLFSSRHHEWSTPQRLFDVLNDSFRFTLDACATAKNAKCQHYFGEEDDGLRQRWTGRVFMNPPYGHQIVSWVKKAFEESQTNAEVVVCLLPARTDTRWWQDYCLKGEVGFIRGRLKFGEARNAAPFPSALVVFSRYANKLTKILSALQDGKEGPNS
jgi:phage N-6-adenine-methyltransferase